VTDKSIKPILPIPAPFIQTASWVLDVSLGHNFLFVCGQKNSGLVELTATSFVLLLTDVASIALDADADAGGYDSWWQFVGRVSLPS